MSGKSPLSFSNFDSGIIGFLKKLPTFGIFYN